jgi:hypothetical protein
MDRLFWKGARAAVYFMFLAAGGAFWTMARLYEFTMAAEIYGHSVSVVAVDIWAAALFIPSVTYLMSLYINGRRWWTPIVRLVSGLIVASNFSAFVASALQAPYGEVVAVWSVVFGGAVVVFASVDAVEARRQWGNRT